jgi:hypothetical protein
VRLRKARLGRPKRLAAGTELLKASPRGLSGGHGSRRPLDRYLLGKTAVQDPARCWEWNGARLPFGYGKAHRDGRTVLAHRLAYECWVGPVPAGMFVLHRCDNAACFNPSHLFIGTQADNLADMRGKNRADTPSGERHWQAKLTAPQVREIRDLCEQGRTQKDVAAAYGVDPSNVSRIARRKAWAHV